MNEEIRGLISDFASAMVAAGLGYTRTPPEISHAEFQHLLDDVVDIKGFAKSMVQAGVVYPSPSEG